MFGGKVTALFRGRREDVREFEPTKSEEGIAYIMGSDLVSSNNSLNQCPTMTAGRPFPDSTAFD